MKKSEREKDLDEKLLHRQTPTLLVLALSTRTEQIKHPCCSAIRLQTKSSAAVPGFMDMPNTEVRVIKRCFLAQGAVSLAKLPFHIYPPTPAPPPYRKLDSVVSQATIPPRFFLFTLSRMESLTARNIKSSGRCELEAPYCANIAPRQTQQKGSDQPTSSIL